MPPKYYISTRKMVPRPILLPLQYYIDYHKNGKICFLQHSPVPVPVPAHYLTTIQPMPLSRLVDLYRTPRTYLRIYQKQEILLRYNPTAFHRTSIKSSKNHPHHSLSARIVLLSSYLDINPSLPSYLSSNRQFTDRLALLTQRSAPIRFVSLPLLEPSLLKQRVNPRTPQFNPKQVNAEETTWTFGTKIGMEIIFMRTQGNDSKNG